MTPPIDTKNPKEPSYNQSLFSIFQIMSREWQLIYPDENENINQESEVYNILNNFIKPCLGNPSEKKQNCDDSRGGQRSKGCEGGFSCRGGRASGVGRWEGRC